MNTTWVLVIWIHSAFWGTGNNMAIEKIEGFRTKQSCEAAGLSLVKLTDGTTKYLIYGCVETGEQK